LSFSGELSLLESERSFLLSSLRVLSFLGLEGTSCLIFLCRNIKNLKFFA